MRCRLHWIICWINWEGTTPRRSAWSTWAGDLCKWRMLSLQVLLLERLRRPMERIPILQKSFSKERTTMSMFTGLKQYRSIIEGEKTCSTSSFLICKILTSQDLTCPCSYLRYGAFAARAEILESKNGPSSFCMLRGFTGRPACWQQYRTQVTYLLVYFFFESITLSSILVALKYFCEGKYTYNGHQYDATARPEGAVYEKCREVITKALKLNAPCHTKNCTFDGVWNGGGGAGQSNIYATSSFYYLASHVVTTHYNWCLNFFFPFC